MRSDFIWTQRTKTNVFLPMSIIGMPMPYLSVGRSPENDWRAPLSPDQINLCAHESGKKNRAVKLHLTSKSHQTSLTGVLTVTCFWEKALQPCRHFVVPQLHWETEWIYRLLKSEIACKQLVGSKLIVFFHSPNRIKNCIAILPVHILHAVNSLDVSVQLKTSILQESTATCSHNAQVIHIFQWERFIYKTFIFSKET